MKRRASRTLIACLIGACTIGASYQFFRSGKSNKTDQPTPTEPQASAQPKTSAEPAKKPETLMAVATVDAPSTQPVSLVLGPTTRPIAFAAPINAPTSTQFLADAKTKLTAGELINARQLLNQALNSSNLSPSEVESTRTMMADINKSLVFSPKVFTGDTYSTLYSVKPGDKLTKIADNNDITWELLCRLNKLDDPKKLRSGRTIKLIKGPFHATVSKSTFKMDIYLGSPGESGSMYITSFNVGLGKDDSTPTGTWQVEPHKKIKNPTYFSPRGEGVIAADDPKNPLGEFWIGLTGIDGQAVGKASYGIHGTIEPETIGKMASMGCIRLRHEDVTQVFELLVEGKSTVVVKE